MAAKSILNELYQRLRTAAPVYKTQADDHSDGFVCFLTLPSVESEWDALSEDRTFQGSGSSKKEAEHAAANAAVEWLTAEKVLRPDPPAASHSSRGTAGPGAPSPTASSATSGVSLSGVGSKRSKSSADFDDESTESLELRILETLAGVYPRTLNGAQLAKLCGHFKLKSKVNHLLYMKLRTAGLVEMLGTHPPAWKVAGPALAATTAAAAAVAGAGAGAVEVAVAGGVQARLQAVVASSAADGPDDDGAPSVVTDTEVAAGAADELEGAEVTSAVKDRPISTAPAPAASTSHTAAIAPAAASIGEPAAAAVCETATSSCSRGVLRQRQPTPAAARTPPPRTPSALAGAASGCGAGGSPAPYARQPAAKQARAGSRSVEQQQQLSMLLQQHLRQQQKAAAESHGAAAAAAVAGLELGQRQHMAKTSLAAAATAAAGKTGAQSPSRSCSYGHSLHTHSHSQAYSQHSMDQQQQSQSCGRSTTAVTAATAAAARRQHALATATAAHAAAAAAVGGAVCAAPASSHGASVAFSTRGARVHRTPGSGTDTDDDDISPAVLAAANEAAALEPAPFAPRPSSSSLSRRSSHQQPLPAAAALAAAINPSTNGGRGNTVVARGLFEQQQWQPGNQPGLILPNVDLLAAMQLNEQPMAQPTQQQQQQQQHEAASPAVATAVSSETAGPVAGGHQQQQQSTVLQQALPEEQQQGGRFDDVAATLQQQLKQLLQQHHTGGVASAAFEALPTSARPRSSAKPQLEAGTKRKYPSLSSSGWEEGRDAVPAAAAAAADMLGGTFTWQEGHLLNTLAPGQQHPGAYSMWRSAPGATATLHQMQDCMQDDQATHQQQQQQGQQYVEQQQLDRLNLYARQVEHQQPQRRRRRSGQGPSSALQNQTRRQGIGLGGASGDASPTHSNAASSDGGSCDVAAAEDMQGPTGAIGGAALGTTGNAGTDAEMTSGGAGAAADLAAALVNLSAGSQARQPTAATFPCPLPSLPQQQQQQHSLGVPGGITTTGPQSAVQADQPAGMKQAQTTGLVKSKPWQLWGVGSCPVDFGLSLQTAIGTGDDVTAGAAKGTSGHAVDVVRDSNPWQWQWQGQQQLFTSPLQQQQGFAQLQPLAQQQQEQQQRLWSSGPQQLQQGKPAHKSLQQLSPVHSCSVVSQGASMVVGGPTGAAGSCNSMGVGNLSPNMLAANGASSRSPASAAAIEQPEVGSIAVATRLSHVSHQQGPSTSVADLQQSEEQALQLLSRLALPGSGAAAVVTPGITARQPAPHGGTLRGDVALSDAVMQGGRGAAALAAQPGGGVLQATGTSMNSMEQGTLANDPVSVAVAAAAAASKAAAAMAAAASFARGGHITTGSGSRSSQGGLAQQAGAAADSSATSAGSAAGSRRSGSAVVNIVEQQQEPAAGVMLAGVPNLAPNGNAQVPNAAAAVAAAVPRQPAVLPAATAVASELAEEYERRMGTVRDLVQQLNEALQGLNSIREKVEGS